MDVRMPDGSVMKNVPEGTPQMEILRKWRAAGGEITPVDMEANAARAMEESLDSRGGFDEFMAGAGKSAVDIVDNPLTRGLLPDRLTESNPEVRQAVDRSVADGAGFAGQVVGDIAATAMPAGWAARGVKAIAPMAGAGTLGAVEGGVASAMLGENPVTGAATGGALGKSLSMLAPAARRVLTGGDVSPNARAIQELGRRTGVDIPMTGGQMVRGNRSAVDKGVNMLEETLPSAPFAGAVGDAREGAMRQWNLATMRDILPRRLQQEVTKVGTDGFDQMRSIFSREYRNILDGMQTLQVSDDALDSMEEVLQRAGRRLTGERSSEVKQTVWNILEDFEGGKLTARKVKTAEKLIREKMTQAKMKGDGELYDMYRELRAVVRQERDRGLGRADAARLNEIDESYAKFADLRDTMQMAGARRNDLFTPEQLDAGWARGRSGTEKAAGSGEMAKRAKQAREVFGAEIPRVGPGTAEKMAAQEAVHKVANIGGALAGGGAAAAGAPVIAAGLALPPILSKALSTRGGARYLTGQLPGQQGTRRALDKVHRMMQEYYQKAGLIPPAMNED